VHVTWYDLDRLHPRISRRGINNKYDYWVSIAGFWVHYNIVTFTYLLKCAVAPLAHGICCQSATSDTVYTADSHECLTHVNSAIKSIDTHLFFLHVMCSMAQKNRCITLNTHRRFRRDSTVELSRVGGVNAPVGSRESWPSLQFHVLLSYWGWWQVTWRHCWKSYQYRSKFTYSQTAMESVWSVSKLSTESVVGSRRELVANSPWTQWDVYVSVEIINFSHQSKSRRNDGVLCSWSPVKPLCNEKW